MHACTSHSIDPASLDMLDAARAAQGAKSDEVSAGAHWAPAKAADLEQAIADLAIVVRGILAELRALNDRQSKVEQQAVTALSALLAGQEI